jgi:hypothetical protein
VRGRVRSLQIFNDPKEILKAGGLILRDEVKKDERVEAEALTEEDDESLSREEERRCESATGVLEEVMMCCRVMKIRRSVLENLKGKVEFLEEVQSAQQSLVVVTQGGDHQPTEGDGIQSKIWLL